MLCRQYLFDKVQDNYLSRQVLLNQNKTNSQTVVSRIDFNDKTCLQKSKSGVFYMLQSIYIHQDKSVNFVQPHCFHVDTLTSFINALILTHMHIFCSNQCYYHLFCLPYSEMSSVCAYAALCLFPSERKTPSGPIDPEMSFCSGPCGTRDHLFSFTACNPTTNPILTQWQCIVTTMQMHVTVQP